MTRALLLLDQAALDVPAVRLQHALDVLALERARIDPLEVPDAEAVREGREFLEDALESVQEGCSGRRP